MSDERLYVPRELLRTVIDHLLEGAKISEARRGDDWGLGQDMRNAASELGRILDPGRPKATP